MYYCSRLGQVLLWRAISQACATLIKELTAVHDHTYDKHINKKLAMTNAQFSKRRDSTILFATLMLFWLLLEGSLDADVLIVGVLVSVAITSVYPDGLSFFTEFRGTPAAFAAGFRYYGYFFRVLFTSNFKLAAIVLSPSLPIEPGIVKVRTKLKTRMGRLMLANSITLTPGTLTVELDGEWIYVHWVTMKSADIEAATAEIVSDFESYIEAMYG